MDLKSLVKKVLSALFSDTTTMVLMFIVTGYSLHAALSATTLVGFLLNGTVALLASVLGHVDLRRRDIRRDAQLVVKIAEEGQCESDSCCQDGHCEVEETEGQDECCSTEAKPEKKVC